MSTQASMVVALAAVTVGSGAGTCRADELTLTRAAMSGVASLIGYERAWDGQCRALTSQVTITGQPAHGSVSVVAGESVIPATTPRGGSTGSCAGQTVSGMQVMYRSEPGYRGADHVAWSVVFGNGRTGRTDVTITVR